VKLYKTGKAPIVKGVGKSSVVFISQASVKLIPEFFHCTRSKDWNRLFPNESLPSLLNSTKTDPQERAFGFDSQSSIEELQGERIPA
jgi:hypothetical protein